MLVLLAPVWALLVVSVGVGLVVVPSGWALVVAALLLVVVILGTMPWGAMAISLHAQQVCLARCAQTMQALSCLRLREPNGCPERFTEFKATKPAAAPGSKVAAVGGRPYTSAADCILLYLRGVSWAPATTSITIAARMALQVNRVSTAQTQISRPT